MNQRTAKLIRKCARISKSLEDPVTDADWKRRWHHTPRNERHAMRRTFASLVDSHNTFIKSLKESKA